MNISNKSKRKSFCITLIIFLPLLAVLLFHGCSSSRYVKMTREMDQFYTALFAGEEATADSISFFRGLREKDIRDYEEAWSPYRREAVSYLLEWEGYTSGGDGSGRNLSSVPDTGDYPLAEAAGEAVRRGDYKGAEALYREFWLRRRGELSGELLYSYSLRRAVARSRRTGEWIDLLESHIQETQEEPGAGEAFFMAWCLEQEDRFDEALTWYERAELRASSGDARRRYLWYSLRLVIREFPSRLIPRLERSGRPGNGDGYFDDIFDDYFSVLVRRRRWAEMAALIPALQKAGLEEVASQGLFLLMRVPDGAYEADEELLRSFEDFSPDPRTYYSLRSYPSLWPRIDAEPAVTGSVPESDEFYTILTAAGYIEEAFALWEERRDGLSMARIEEFCAWLEGEDRLYDLIAFAGYWYYRCPSDEVPALMSRVYPGARRYILPEADLPAELVLGVIRRESAFDAAISSHAGAVGLMQLMPSTAEDVARRHRMEEWDLQNPEDNILLGSLYLEWLKERPWSSSFIDVLAAYNGGGGNLRYWKRTLPGEDPELFIQSIPFRETRDYIRKVIVAAASYRYLETGSPPGEWLDQFYRPF
jgi:tetratricopeptide (TPR) repeat protein